jgi:hypothetical protein
MGATASEAATRPVTERRSHNLIFLSAKRDSGDDDGVLMKFRTTRRLSDWFPECLLSEPNPIIDTAQQSQRAIVAQRFLG